MLDHFLSAAYESSQKEQQKRAFIEDLKKLPMSDLLQLANGGVKIASLCGNSGTEWLEKFKGTPLFDQALQLEQAEIQEDIARQQRSQERRDEWAGSDQIRLQKRLLELQLMQSQNAAAAPPLQGPPVDKGVAPPDAQGAGAPGGEVVPQSPGPLGGKMAGVWSGWQKQASPKAGELAAAADQWGRELAHADAEKQASATKTALSMPSVNWASLSKGGLQSAGQAIKSVAGTRAGRGALIGAGVGALGGAAEGMQKDDRGQRSILRGITHGLGGAALGAGAGGAIGMAAPHLQGGLKALQAGTAKPGEVLKGVSSGIKADAQQVLHNFDRNEWMRQATGKTMATAAPTAASPAAGAATRATRAATPAAKGKGPSLASPEALAPTVGMPAAKGPALTAGQPRPMLATTQPMSADAATAALKQTAPPTPRLAPTLPDMEAFHTPPTGPLQLPAAPAPRGKFMTVQPNAIVGS